MALSLGIITIGASALLAWVNSLTAGPIEEARQKSEIDAIKSVTPPFDNNPRAEAWDWIPETDTVPFIVYPAMENGAFVGAAVNGYSKNGFGGEIKVMYGFDSTGAVTGYQVLSHAETPGLGAKMQEWFSMDAGNRSVLGKDPAQTAMYVSKDAGGAIDGITAATITSRAFLETLRNCYKAFEAYKVDHGYASDVNRTAGDATTGATSHHQS
ncbi:RnfABCDGE type electron transport complex subunit G [uncultured Muribaculum sp.]|uniref:RnfABCDGE type electron transport complex subunit G n=1 Tax=uncultured Muribaculum sp. TaxID=1918613 RepID=UPI0025D1C2B9|nr:RnfABCDGE type electron transport complex subunit G [uncultured Muribaculum sp.]